MIRQRRWGGIAGLSVFLAALSVAPAARADDDDRNKAVATDLFDAGVRKMKDGQCDQPPIKDRAVCEEARDAFKRAYALYPGGLGALRNLAYVEQHLGLVASAARNFRELTRKAPLDPNPARRLWAEFAQKEFESLAPRIPRLTIEVPAERPPEMKLLLDGNALPDAAWQTALEIDPGKHTVRAEAPGYVAFEQSFDLVEKQEKRLIVELLPAPEEERKEPSAPAPTLAPVAETPKPKSRVLPLVVSGVGVVTVGVGLGLGYVAIQKKKDACGDEHFCEPDTLESGRSTARASTIVTSIGAATLAGGLVWYFLSAPRKSGEAAARVVPSVGPRGGGVAAIGTF
jgi:hypothetical protein